MTTTRTALGLMSGTSLDGIDVALIETDGESVVRRAAGPLSGMTFPYAADVRRRLVEAIAHARHVSGPGQRPGLLAVVERELTELNAAAVSAFLRKSGRDRAGIDVIGYHGQTVLHRPEAGYTVQLGDGALLAELTQRPVVFDMRSADMAAGGQGAPLVPAYHRALLAQRAERPLAVLNIGGVANVTYIGANDDLVAFDTGPGNALIDDWMLRHTGQPCDVDGGTAARGTPDPRVVTFYCDHEFFRRPPPKSLDRDAFFADLVGGMGLEDGAATLTAFTAEAVARAERLLPAPPRLWIVSGGGRRNATLMGMIAARVSGQVIRAEAAGLDGESLEAEAWAYLAVRSLEGLPLTYPGTTGVPAPMTGGRHMRPPAGLAA
ncbi:MAG: anhydro-N-acetylmuramic acid kinase [Hyphomicrobiaceae bacterium]|nr:anhydro-N-acetylmuramic acid kinase [Hyphomicrobiaceae bacterium]